MRPILFLSVDDVIKIHHNQIAHYGGTLGIRDLSLLQSAIAIPASTFDGVYLHKSIYEMSAAYLFHICKNHPFLDGNKRTATATAITFLYLQGIEWIIPEEELEYQVREVAEGKQSKTQLTLFFESSQDFKERL